MHEKFRTRLLHFWSDLIVAHPRLVLALALLMAVGAVVLTMQRLTFQSSRNDLIAPDLPWNQRFIDWQASFPGAGDLVVVVDTVPPPGVTADPAEHQARARALVRELGQRLQDHPLVERAIWGFDPQAFSPRAVRLLPMPEFTQRMAQMTQARLLLESPSLPALLDNARQATAPPESPGTASPLPVPEGGSIAPGAPPSAGSPTPPTLADQLAALGQLVQAIDQGLATPVDQPLPLDLRTALADDAQGQADWQYLESPNGRLLFIAITPREQAGSVNVLEAPIDAVRQTIAEASTDYPGIDAGLTGIEVIEADETESAITDSTRASILALVVIAALLITAFHSWRTPILALIALLLGIAWTFGFVTLSIGHLQVLSVVFCVILMGLGIGYGIHLIAGFELVRHQFADTPEGFRQAMRLAFQKVGPGIVTAAVTTAAAFLTTLPTDFIGVAEMGLIAAAGVILCLLAMFSVFPALLRLVKPSHKHIVAMEERRVHLFEERWVTPFIRRPWVTLILAFALTAACIGYMTVATRFDYDLLKLQPTGVPSVIWAQRIQRQGEQSIWHGISIVDDMQEARELAAKLRQLDLVSPDLGGVGMLIPPNEPAKLAMLQRIRTALEPALSQALQAPQDAAEPSPTAAAPDALLAELTALRGQLQLAVTLQLLGPATDAAREVIQRIERISALARALEPPTLERRLSRLNQTYQAFRQQVAGQLAIALDGQPLGLKDVPQTLMRGYVSEDGRLAIEINPEMPRDIVSPYDPAFLPRFVESLEAVDPEITGVPVQIYKSGILIQRAYIIAGILALVLVFAFVWVDFQRLSDALLSLLPVTIGFAVTFALITLLGETINMANIIVLPLMFGIGVDAGVHVLHRYRQDPMDQPPGLTHGTGKGVTITSLTTAIGFAAMLPSSHRGIRSLGIVMTTGILLTMFACWFVMPAWLVLRQRRGVDKEALE